MARDESLYVSMERRNCHIPLIVGVYVELRSGNPEK